METNNMAARQKPFTLSELDELLAKSNPIAFGFVVSQELFDALRARVPAKFAGGNCFGSTPIVVDQKLKATEFEIAFTEAAWHKRLSELPR